MGSRFGYRAAVHEADSPAARLSVVAALLVGAVAVASAPARARGADGPAAPAAVEPASVIAGTSTCPTPNAVWSEVTTLLPRERLHERLRVLASPTPLIDITDGGATVRVVAAGRVREFRDDARDCAYRARVAAVFAALTIDPAALIAPPPPPAASAPPPPPPEPPPPPVPPPPPPVRIELGGAVDAGVGPSTTAVHTGGALRLAAGRGRLAFVTGVTPLLPADVSVGGVRLRQWRLPVDAGVRVRATSTRVEAYGELGIAAALLSERALDLARADSRATVELGVRAAAGYRLATASRFAPFIALQAELVPFPPAIFALPQGIAGHTPLLWIGATAGVSMGVP